MTVQMPHLTERFTAYITGIWTLSSVYPLMIFEATLVIE
jgi:hypothetical protein